MVGKSTEYVKTFNCPSCGGKINLRATGFSLSAVCSHCQTIVDTKDENYKIIEYANLTSVPALTIPIGSRGKIKNVLWECIGFIHKQDQEGFNWKEYLLFNPRQGYRWLSEYEGHFNFIQTIKKKPQEKYNDIIFENKKFHSFSKYRAIILHLAGEFYWQVSCDEKVNVLDYIHPPFLLSMEKSPDEITWSLCEKIDSYEVFKAFKLEKLPPINGIAPNQLNPFQISLKSIEKWFLAFCLLIFFIQIRTLATSLGTVIHEEEFSLSPDNAKPTRTKSFVIPGKNSNVEISMLTNIQNSWVELQAELINDDKNEDVYEFNENSEYYFGRDSDGNWAEGSPNSNALISNVPKGNYHINFESLETESSPYGQSIKPSDFKIVVKRDVQTWSNFWLTFFALLIIPIYYFIRSRRFEAKRWEMSSQGFL
jgi:hypothetical protein